jgi:modulator of FtsH protease
MDAWTNFFLGELGAAAALAGLLFVSLSVNQARILEIGRMADRGLEALFMLFLIIADASLGLVPGQPPRFLGVEFALAGAVLLALAIPAQRQYMAQTEPQYRAQSSRMVWMNRLAVGLTVVAGLVLAVRDDGTGLYLFVAGALLTFLAVGLNAWVLLIEINR